MRPGSKNNTPYIFKLKKLKAYVQMKHSITRLQIDY